MFCVLAEHFAQQYFIKKIQNIIYSVRRVLKFMSLIEDAIFEIRLIKKKIKIKFSIPILVNQRKKRKKNTLKSEKKFYSAFLVFSIGL